ncbi:MAG: class II glutamine amidotransferase [Geminicoccaceae bacterium]
MLNTPSACSSSAWRRSGTAPGRISPLADRFTVVSEVAGALARLGNANFLYSDGDVLFAHAHLRCWDEGDGRFQRAAGTRAEPARMQDLSVKGLKVEVADDATDATYVASVPLTDTGWTPLPESTVVALRNGRIVMQGVAGS